MNIQQSSEGEKGDWKIKTASNGLLFYFNTKVDLKKLFKMNRQKNRNGKNLMF